MMNCSWSMLCLKLSDCRWHKYFKENKTVLKGESKLPFASARKGNIDNVEEYLFT